MTPKLATLAMILAIGITPASAEWIHDMMIEDCSEESRDRLAAATRQKIELSVRRAESSIEPPAPIGDLGCLDGLMDINIDVFAPVGPLSQIFSGSLDGVLNQAGDTRRFCRFARRRWNEMTNPLTQSLTLLKKGLPPDFIGRVSSRTTNEDQQEPDPAPEVQPPNRRGFQDAGHRQSVSEERSKRQETGGSRDPIENIWNLLYGDGN